MSTSTQTITSQLRLARARSLLSEIISARASLGQLPQETAELPLTGLMSVEGQEVMEEFVDASDPELFDFAPMRLGELRSPSLDDEGPSGGPLILEGQEELMEALREASDAHTGETDELALSPSSDLEAALSEALDEVGDVEGSQATPALMVSQPTPVAFHPNQPAPIRALWGRRGFTPTPELVQQQQAQPSSPRLAFEESQELLELVSASNQGPDEPSYEASSAEGEPVASIEPLMGEALSREVSQEDRLDPHPALMQTAAYVPVDVSVELSDEAPEVTTEAQGAESSATAGGFGGMSSSPDEPRPEVLGQAWTEVAGPTQKKGRGGLWATLCLLALGGVAAYYYYSMML